MRGLRLFGWTSSSLLVAAMLGLLGHVCVVPLHAHAVPVEGHGSHDSDTAGHSIHTASCEATKGGPTVAALVPTPRVVELTEPPRSTRFWGIGPTPDVPTAESPPLFLLHASLLI